MINISAHAERKHHDQRSDHSHSHPPRSVPGTSAESLSKGDRALVIGRLKARSWETPEGERRSVVEVEAEEVGPSLKWATATPQRTRKAGNGPNRGGQFNDDPPF